MKTPKLLPNQSRTQLPPGDYVTTTAAARNLATAASRILFNFPQKHFVLFCYFMLFSSLVFFSNESAAQRKARIQKALLLHGYAMSNTCHAATRSVRNISSLLLRFAHKDISRSAPPGKHTSDAAAAAAAARRERACLPLSHWRVGLDLS